MSAAAGITDRLVAYASSVDAASSDGAATLVAKTSVLDWIGCALAGSREPLMDIMVRTATAEGASPRATVLGRDLKTSLRWASLLNGAASHALDYDDTNFMVPSHPIHPTAPVLPAVLALGEDRRASGSAVLTAFIAGVETECRLGAVLGVEHYREGWHSTSTLGTFGSTAACAHLMDLEVSQWHHAFGIASTSAAGLKSVFGSMSKPLQTGRAAADGVLAASLAADGFTSETAIVEVDQGFAATHGGMLHAEMLDEIGERFMIADTVFKYHASCYFTHSAIEAARAIAGEGIGAVESVKVLVPAQHLAVCNIAEPTTGLEGKFSLRATVAMALLGDDTADPAVYVDERMSSPDLVAMRDKVMVSASSAVDGTETKVEIEFAGGTTRSEVIDVGVPATDLQRQWRGVAAKFERLATPVVGQLRAREIEQMVERLEDLQDVSELTELCRGEA